ncbi:MAG TPA: hypothetical protein VFZ16_05940 [Hyphomicrobiaceae bacterium]|nr:hypothetical protein [Hyphomicrobiaceae bacterium]
MVNALSRSPPGMTVAEFLAWLRDRTGRKFQLVDGEVRVMSPARGRLQSTLARLIGNGLSAYCKIPSVREIAVVHSARVLVELLRRRPEGGGPEQTDNIGGSGPFSLESIAFSCPLSDIHARTHLGN